MDVVAALGQLAAQFGADDSAAAVRGEDCNADVHKKWGIGSGEWRVESGESAITPTPHSPFPTPCDFKNTYSSVASTARRGRRRSELLGRRTLRRVRLRSARRNNGRAPLSRSGTPLR